jgi:hypothetical protein
MLEETRRMAMGGSPRHSRGLRDRRKPRPREAVRNHPMTSLRIAVLVFVVGRATVSEAADRRNAGRAFPVRAAGLRCFIAAARRRAVPGGTASLAVLARVAAMVRALTRTGNETHARSVAR